jgi:hypothetical protein
LRASNASALRYWIDSRLGMKTTKKWYNNISDIVVSIYVSLSLTRLRGEKKKKKNRETMGQWAVHGLWRIKNFFSSPPPPSSTSLFIHSHSTAVIHILFW